MTVRFLWAAWAGVLLSFGLLPAAAKDIEMQSIYPAPVFILGDSAVVMTEKVSVLTGGSLNIVFRNPGELVPNGEVWDAVSIGAIDAAWTSPGFAEGVIPSAPLFSAFPFGPFATEYLAWWYEGGGAELWAEVSAPLHIHTELCAILGPDAAGWFNREINSVADLDGLRMRLFGLGAATMGKLGADARGLMPAEAMSALNTGAIDAAEMSFPLIDEQIGMFEHADLYYFPGWQQRTSLVTLVVNRDVWEALEDREQLAVREVCAANVTRTAAKGEAAQPQSLERLTTDRGVKLRELPAEVLAALETAWGDVAHERAAADPEFARVWQHISDFRAAYSGWSGLAYR
jgi:TRAP-type mannitol/chloroaromatic compound transport system substrate-binding protein